MGGRAEPSSSLEIQAVHIIPVLWLESFLFSAEKPKIYSVDDTLLDTVTVYSDVFKGINCQLTTSEHTG
jgi:hypothetical protein